MPLLLHPQVYLAFELNVIYQILLGQWCSVSNKIHFVQTTAPPAVVHSPSSSIHKAGPEGGDPGVCTTQDYDTVSQVTYTAQV